MLSLAAGLRRLARSCCILLGLHVQMHGVLLAANLPTDLEVLGPPSPDLGPCKNYSFSTPQELADDLVEMSGIVPSQLYKNLFYHVRDSGNEPLLILTDRAGKVLGRFSFAPTAVDPEELGHGPCPTWNGACIYVADIGDNLHWRRWRRLYAIEEASIFKAKPRIETISFAYEGGENLDAEAIAVDPLKGDIFIFSKEKEAKVFLLPKGAWHEGAIAKLLTKLPLPRITGASFSPDGQRVLLLNSKGAHEFSERGKGSWFSKQNVIKLPQMAQQEAITYLGDGRSFIYSSEKKRSSNKGWGMIEATCQVK